MFTPACLLQTIATARTQRPLALAALLSAAAALGLSAAVSQAAPVFDYQFTGTLGGAIPSLVDSSANALNGTVAGAVNYVATGAGGGSSAAGFGGDFNYATTNASTLMNLQEFTLSAMARPVAAGFGPADFSTIVIKETQNNNCNFCGSWGLLYSANLNRYQAFIAFTIAGLSTTGVLLTAADAFSIGEWHEVTLSLDRDVNGAIDELTLYVDGQLQASSSGVFAPVVYNNNAIGGRLTIGAANLGGLNGPFRRNFNGDIDEVTLLDTPFAPNVVPAPGSLALLGAAPLGLGASRRRAESFRLAESDAPD